MFRVTDSNTRFTYAEYEKMAFAGIFSYRRVELINGRVYRCDPTDTPHMSSVTGCTDALFAIRQPDDDWVVIRGTLRLDEFSALEPDLLWLPVPIGTPSANWPSPILLIEVSETTYKRDSGVKLRKYAEHAISDYWILNLPANRIEVYRQPQNPTGKPVDCRYDSVQHFSPGQSITLLNRPGVSLAVNELLP